MPRTRATPALYGADVKACCADLYAGDWLDLLLGDSLHPGGLELTHRLARLAGIGSGTRVLDIASGRGATAIYLAKHYGCEVVGIDYSARSVGLAQEAARRAGVGTQTLFAQGDAEHLDLADESFDAVICECAFCTFPDKPAAAGEMARVLRPGGRAALSDLTRSGDLPDELQSWIAWMACIADALSLDEYGAHLMGAGLIVEYVGRHDDALRQLIRDVRAKLVGAEVLLMLKRLELPGVDVKAAAAVARSAAAAVDAGRLGYGIVVGAKRGETRGIPFPTLPNGRG